MTLWPQVVHSLHKQSHITKEFKYPVKLLFFVRQSRDTNQLNFEAPASWIDFIQTNQAKCLVCASTWKRVMGQGERKCVS